MKLNPNILFFHYDCASSRFKVSRFQSFKAKGKDNSRVPPSNFGRYHFFGRRNPRRAALLPQLQAGVIRKTAPSGNDAFYLTAGLLLSMLLFLTLKL